MWDKQRCFYSDIFVAFSAIGILLYNTPLEVIFAENHLAVAVPTTIAFPGIGICSVPLDWENGFSKKNEMSNQIPMLCFLLYTKPLLAPHRAASCSKQNRLLLQSKTQSGYLTGLAKQTWRYRVFDQYDFSRGYWVCRRSLGRRCLVHCDGSCQTNR